VYAVEPAIQVPLRILLRRISLKMEEGRRARAKREGRRRGKKGSPLLARSHSPSEGERRVKSIE